MLADPLPVDASYITAADIPRISSEQNKSVYSLVVSGVTYIVTIQHTYTNGRRRSLVRLDAKAVVSDPLSSVAYAENSSSVYLVIDRNERLVTDATVIALVKELLGGVLGFCTFANAVETTTTAIVGGQS